MAATAVKGTNVTKFDAGGSGDNYIADGYIKSVEKIWMDDYTLTSNVTGTNTTISLATLPTNKKITSVEIVIDTSAAQTSGTVAVGFSTDASVDTLLGATNITHNLTTTTIRLPAGGVTNNLNSANGIPKIAGFQKVTAGTQVTIALNLNNWTMTTGTIKSIVRYT